MAVEHRQAARDVKTADRDLNTGVTQRTGNVERAWILVRLHAGEHDQAEIAMARKLRDQCGNIDAVTEFIDRLNVDFNISPEDTAGLAVLRNSINAGEGIRGNCSAPPTDHIAVFAVMRRLYEHQLETTL